jgi:hypothetical protein
VIGSALAMTVAAARVIERRVRTSRTLRRNARNGMAMLARLSREGRAFVRLRLMPIV